MRAHLRSFGLALTLCAWPAALVAQVGDRTSVGTVQHPALAPGGRLGLRTVPTVVAARWASAARARLATQQVARQHDALMLALYPPPTEPVILGIPPLEPPPGLGPAGPSSRNSAR
ncbi:MAG: hypothetical protein WEC54_02220, partial [Gemmatimonadales bacterium]